MHKILVTGSNGYIGSRLVPDLLDEGFDVLGYDTGFFQDSKLYQCSNYDFIRGDMRSFNSNLLEGVSSVVHLASIANDPFGNLNYERIYDPITEYSTILAEMCKKRKIKFIWPSSCSVYGIASGYSDENSTPNPQTPYSKNKVDFEGKLLDLSDNNFQPIILRLCTLYGLSPRIRFDLVVNMFAGMAFTSKEIVLNSDGQSWRPLVHIKDVINSIKHAITDIPILQDHEFGKAILVNVGDNNENYRIIDLANIISEIRGNCSVKLITESPNSNFDEKDVADQNIESGKDVRTYKVNFDKILRTYPKFKPKWGIEKGVSELFEKFREINLDKDTFTSSKFYRIRTMEKLHAKGEINDDLLWV